MTRRSKKSGGSARSESIDNALSGSRDYSSGGKVLYSEELVGKYGHDPSSEGYIDNIRVRMHQGKAYVNRLAQSNSRGDELSREVNEAYKQSEGFGYNENMKDAWSRQPVDLNYGESIRNAWINAIRKNPNVLSYEIKSDKGGNYYTTGTGQSAVSALASNGYVDDAVKYLHKAFSALQKDPSLNKDAVNSLLHLELANIYRLGKQYGSEKEHLLKSGSQSYIVSNRLDELDKSEFSGPIRSDRQRDPSRGRFYRVGGHLKDKIIARRGYHIGHLVEGTSYSNMPTSYEPQTQRSSGLSAYFAADKKIQSKGKSSKKFATLAVVGLGGASFAIVGSQLTGNAIGVSDSLPSLLGTGSLILGFLGIVGLLFYFRSKK